MDGLYDVHAADNVAKYRKALPVRISLLSEIQRRLIADTDEELG